jgi:hypothetical protein
MKRLYPTVPTCPVNPMITTLHANSPVEANPSQTGGRGWATLILALVCLASSARAASVGPGGYANSFAGLPAPGDWSTMTVAGGVSDVGNATDLDGAVQLLAASSITTQIASDAGNPPAAHALATWSSSLTGQYLQTRPTGVKMCVLMATLVNNTGTNANRINVSYDFTMATSVAEEILGHRVYYSFTGAAGDWVNIPALDSPAAGHVSASVTLTSPWNTGTTLYLLWADDNGSGSPDDANQIDNFSIAAYYVSQPLSIALNAPANGQRFGASA